jgi:hypothetical protein
LREHSLVELLARDIATAGIADHASEISDHENHGVTQILKVLQLSKEDRVAEMQIGAVGSKPALTRSGLPVGQLS